MVAVQHRLPPAGCRPVSHRTPASGLAARPRSGPAPGSVVPPGTYRRRRAVAGAVVAALVAAATVVLGALGGEALTAPERQLPAVAGELYEVRRGDTLWDIARRLDPGADPRPLVDRLVADNGGRAQLVAGQGIRLPQAP